MRQFYIRREGMPWDGNDVHGYLQQVLIQPVGLPEQPFHPVTAHGISDLFAHHQPQPRDAQAVWHHVKDDLPVLNYLTFLKNLFKLPLFR